MSNKYYLKVDITVKEGKMTHFVLLTEQLAPLVKEAAGWRLLAALSAVTDVPNTVFHLWELPDANALLLGMQFFASDEIYDRYSDLLACCVQQKQELYTAMRYNPLGHNTKSVVPPSPGVGG